MAAAKEVRADCPKCGPNRNAQIVARHTEHQSDGEVESWDTYRVIRCAGCSHIQLQIVSAFSEDYDLEEAPDGTPYMKLNERITYWPPLTKRAKPDWLRGIEQRDDTLGAILAELYKALDNDMPMAASVAMRTGLDRATALLKIDPAATFDEKLKALVTAGEIAPLDYRVLAPLVNAGNAAAHRGWMPTSSELNTMTLILEAFLHRAFILNMQVKKLAKGIPKKKRRRKKKVS